MKHTEDAESSYTNQTAYEKYWGLAKDHHKWERGNYNDGWIQVRGKWQKNYQRRGRKSYGDGPSSNVSVSPTIISVGRGELSNHVPCRDGESLMGFGDYHDWTYGDIMTNKPNYATYVCQESFGIILEHQKFQEWVTLKTFGNEQETMGGWKEQNPKRSM